MYTDTKNLAHQLADMSLTGVNTHLPPSTPMEKSKRKLCKMWRPLLRLMARKRHNSATTTAIRSSNVTRLHPNNVHLNNTTVPPTRTDTISSSAEWPTALIEDYASLMRKMSCKEECNHGTGESATANAVPEWERPCQASAKFATTVISSASIEKTPASTCAHCVYGRNCQHEQFHHHICDAATTTTTTATTETAMTTVVGAVNAPTVTDATTTLSQHVLADLPIQFIQTDEGTFFWTNSQEKIDDDLLTAWLCHSWRQLPVQAALL
ncbi:enhancer of split M2 protein [Ceratitis capitata]|uniref:enhancer of split M2 protein n=1 Tax=Ceratitis capitata TaxID=7213 RepID=UPI000329E73B|nr:enhancer of split M2 protein [Ceratitis capitata]